MLDLSPVVQRLQDRCTLFKDVDFALSLELAMDQVKRTPCVYLLQSSTQAGPQRAASGVHIQQSVERFDLLLFVNATGATTGTSARAKRLTDVLAATVNHAQAALLGWTWDVAVNPLRLTGGKLVDLHQGVLIWRDSYETDTQLRVTTPT